jgi:hypothetical protein
MLLLGLQVGFLLNDLGGPSPGRKGFITDWEAMVSLETVQFSSKWVETLFIDLDRGWGKGEDR